MAEALSQMTTLDCNPMIIHQMQPDMSQKIQHAFLKDVNLQQLKQELKTNPNSHKHYHWINEELRKKKGRLVVGNDVELRQFILQ